MPFMVGYVGIRSGEVCEPSLLGPEIIYEALKKVRSIRDRLKTSYSLQTFYSDNRRRDIDFKVGDMVY